MQVVLTVPDEHYEQVNEIAQHRKQDVQVMLQEILLDAITLLADNEEPLLLVKEFRLLQDSHLDLFKQYPNQWIAIKGQAVVDHDSDRMALEQLIVEVYGDEPVLVEQVTRILKTEIVVRSPHFE